jgi:hypothetical protein
MESIQIESVEEPLATPAAVALAYALIARAQTMGYWPSDLAGPVTLGRELLAQIAKEIEDSGVAVVPAARLRLGTEEDLLAALRETVEAVDGSPRPEGEWAPTREMLGDDLLATVLGGLSQASLRRYATGERRTPDPIAWRLHVVARILSSLLGSYNAYGVRRWFDRPRGALDGETPAAIVASATSEDDVSLRRVVALADELVGPAAA